MTGAKPNSAPSVEKSHGRATIQPKFLRAWPAAPRLTGMSRPSPSFFSEAGAGVAEFREVLPGLAFSRKTRSPTAIGLCAAKPDEVSKAMIDDTCSRDFLSLDADRLCQL